MPNPIYHQVAFGALVLLTVGRYFILLRRLPASPQSQSRALPEKSNPSTQGFTSGTHDEKTKVSSPTGLSKTPSASSPPTSRPTSPASLSTSSTITSEADRLRLGRQAQPALRDKIISTLTRGIYIFILGFALWNIDNFFCDHLNEFRVLTRSKGWAVEIVGLITHGHGWWHFFTGYGAFLINTSGICEWCLFWNSPHPSLLW